MTAAFARFIPPVVHLHHPFPNKIHNGDILIPANPGPPGNWPLKQTQSDVCSLGLPERNWRQQLVVMQQARSGDTYRMHLRHYDSVCQSVALSDTLIYYHTATTPLGDREGEAGRTPLFSTLFFPSSLLPSFFLLPFSSLLYCPLVLISFLLSPALFPSSLFFSPLFHRFPTPPHGQLGSANALLTILTPENI